MKRATALLVTFAVVLPLPAAAGPGPRESPLDASARKVEPTTADDWLRLGLARYDEGDFRGAVEAFRRGHALDPRPQFLFAIAQAERRRGDCAAAIRAYDLFLATSPAEEQAEAALEQRERCERALRPPEPPPEPEPVPEPEPEPEPAAPPRPPAAPARPARDGWRDPVTITAGAAGAALALTGAGLLIAADAAAGNAGLARGYDEYLTLRDRARARHTAGLVTLGAGVAAGAFAAYRALRGAPDEPAPRLGVTPGPGVGLGVAGSF